MPAALVGQQSFSLPHEAKFDVLSSSRFFPKSWLAFAIQTTQSMNC